MINQIEIANFKCFQDPITLKFSRLNLLTGVNGRGKSSVLQAILLLSQSVLNFSKLDRLKLEGKHIDVGNYDDIKNSDTPRSEEISFKFEMDNIIAHYGFKEDEKDELTAIINTKDIKAGLDWEYTKFQSVITDAVNSLTEQLNAQSEQPTNQAGNMNELPLPEYVFNYLISNVHYISANRLGPVKYVDKTSLGNSEFLSVGPKGEHTINILANNNLPVVSNLLYLGSDAKSVIQQTEEWLSYILDGAKIKIEGLEKTSSVLWMLINNKSNSYKYKPTNVGFGYSYVLPLIVTGLIAKPGEVVVIENPEAHLHPKAQSRISEFFTLVAANGIQVFIESHSEHILNGLRVNMLKNKSLFNGNELSLYYFNENFDATKLIVDDKGKISNWPLGFFDQQEMDLASIFKLSR